MGQDEFEKHLRRGAALLRALTSLLNCALEIIPANAPSSSSALAGAVFLATELADELEKLEELILGLGALGGPPANDPGEGG